MKKRQFIILDKVFGIYGLVIAYVLVFTLLKGFAGLRIAVESLFAGGVVFCFLAGVMKFWNWKDQKKKEFGLDKEDKPWN